MEKPSSEITTVLAMIRDLKEDISHMRKELEDKIRVLQNKVDDLLVKKDENTRKKNR